jgi:hypothetical protein
MTVNDMELMKLAEDAGFRVALIPAMEIPVMEAHSVRRSPFDEC